MHWLNKWMGIIRLSIVFISMLSFIWARSRNGEVAGVCFETLEAKVFSLSQNGKLWRAASNNPWTVWYSKLKSLIITTTDFHYCALYAYMSVEICSLSILFFPYQCQCCCDAQRPHHGISIAVSALPQPHGTGVSFPLHQQVAFPMQRTARLHLTYWNFVSGPC